MLPPPIKVALWVEKRKLCRYVTAEVQQKCEQKKSSWENTSHTERLYRNLGIKQEANNRKDRMGEEITKD